jgi:Ca2+-binding EF-hand superfamily protein
MNLIRENGGQSRANFEGFCRVMSVFCYDTVPEVKRQMLFKIYDKDNKNEIPMTMIRSILTDELFVRTHYSEIQPGIQLKSSYSDRIMRDIMEDVMHKFDQDANKLLDYQEFT